METGGKIWMAFEMIDVKFEKKKRLNKGKKQWLWVKRLSSQVT